MADNTNPLDLFEGQTESSAFSNDDFEKLDAPVEAGFAAVDQNEVAYAGAYEPNQDAEVSTTTDADISGEEEPEEDRYTAGAGAQMPPSESLISWGDEDEIPQVQPSAPVPEYIEPLISFDNSSEDPLKSLNEPILHTSSSPDPILPSNSPHPSQLDAFNESEKGDEHVGGESKQPSSDQAAVDVAKGSWLKGVDPRESSPEVDVSPQFLIDLIYWRDVKKSGIVFGAMMVVLLSLAIFSLLSVVAYLSLATLTVTFSFTVYKKVMGAVQKSNEGHPFKQLIDLDISLIEDKLKCVIQSVLKNVNCTACELRRLFLIEDMVDSIKFGLLLWVLTYIGAWFNGMTLIILGIILLFTLPKVYETYKVQIDNYIGLAKGHIDNVFNIVQSKLPFLKKKEKAQ